MYDNELKWYICFGTSILAFLLSVAAAIVIAARRRRHQHKSRIFTPLNVLFAGTFIAGFMLALPFYLDVTANQPKPAVLKTILLTLRSTFQSFTMEGDGDFILNSLDLRFGAVYTTYMSIMYTVAPILTLGVVVSFFKNISANIRYIFRYFHGDVYAFSALNERSIALGRDIAFHHSNETIVYCNVSPDEGEDTDELVDAAASIGAICFKKDINAVELGRHSKGKKLYLFTLDADENKNMIESLSLTERFRDRDGARLFVFSTSPESELLFTGASDKKLQVHRVNEARAFVTRMLYEDGVRFFKNAVPAADGQKLISAVIVGLGSYGTEMLKALTWFCQMDGYRIVIDAFDRDELAGDKFAKLCPELMSPAYNGVYVHGESEYCIRIHSGIDPATKTFADEIAKLSDATYAFVALDTDEETVRTAADLRIYFERMHIHPEIDAAVRSTPRRKALEGVKNFRGQAYDIRFVADMESSYSERNIIKSDLEADALARHLKYGQETDFWRYEYNYNSSMASAVHMRARIAMGIPGAGKAEAELTETERHGIEVLEHRRWNAYMRSEGYVYSGSHDKASRNDLAKMHHDLVDFESLSEEDKRKDSKVGAK